MKIFVAKTFNLLLPTRSTLFTNQMLIRQLWNIVILIITDGMSMNIYFTSLIYFIRYFERSLKDYVTGSPFVSSIPVQQYDANI